jgi:hypothetical protein
MNCQLCFAERDRRELEKSRDRASSYTPEHWCSYGCCHEKSGSDRPI